MVDEHSQVPSSCDIATNAEVLKSILHEEVVVEAYTQVLQSKLGDKVQLLVLEQ